MKSKWTAGGLALLVTLSLTACGTSSGGSAQGANGAGSAGGGAAQTPTQTQAPAATSGQEAKAKTRTMTFLDKTYTVPEKAERIVITGALESMEDAMVLGINPVGAISVSGKFPDMFKSITGKAVSIGEKTEPNFEKILSLKPDVILGSSKFKPEVMEQLSKMAPTLPMSHISTNWEANLLALGELTGKKAEADKVISQYQADLKAAKAQLGEKMKDKKIVIVRVRAGSLYIYPESVFFNPSLYGELGFTVPAEVKAAKAQELISLEKFSQMNPDYVFVQFSEDENKDAPKALESLQSNPIWKSIAAVKNNKVFVNVVDPLAQGGASWGKIEFLKAAVAKLSGS